MQNIHPLFVHFPIALLSVGLLFDALGYFLKKESLAHAGWWCFSLGVISAVVTVFTGMQAEDTISLSPAAEAVLETHEQFQIYSTAVLVGLLIWRSFRKGGLPRWGGIYWVVSAIAVSTILYGSHFGGRLVYEYGAGTAVQPPATQEVQKQHQQWPEQDNPQKQHQMFLATISMP
ncbi:MAG: DUF2231 domain-containing protein [Oculatellaceae cyanobacterium Prado106]|jgi:uncharacterized membrane protein|nr:DUF2231 domain-containing protein [Oculatellaceae cyanobacterium Prado106]